MNVAKGKGQYAGEGGFMTTLLSALTAVANNPVVKRLGKKAAKQAVDKVADFAKSKVSNSLGGQLCVLDDESVEMELDGARRLHRKGPTTTWLSKITEARQVTRGTSNGVGNCEEAQTEQVQPPHSQVHAATQE